MLSLDTVKHPVQKHDFKDLKSTQITCLPADLFK